MRFLRQSTASQEILLGPFVATADGTAQTGLTIANTDIKLLLGGATSEQNKNSGGGTHIAGGRYSAVLDATDTATVGILEVSVAPASGIPWSKSYYVLEEAIYDALFAASANAFTGAAGSTVLTALATGSVTAGVVATGAIDADAIADNAIDAGAIASNALALAKFATDTRNAFGFTTTGTLSGTHSDTTADLGASAPTSDIEGQTLYFSDHDISRLVTSYDTGTGVATFASIGVTLANGNTWYRYPTAPSSGGSGPTAAEIADAVWDEATAGHTTSGTFGEQCKTDIDAILADTGTDGVVVASIAANAITSTAIQNDAITAAKIAAGAIEAVTFAADVDAEILSYIVDDATRIDASDLNSKVDSLTFTVANVLDANIQRINDVAVTGDGSGTPFDVA